MGFGLLFIGYFMTYLMSVSYAGYLIRLVGYALMLYAFTKLCAYNRTFKLPLYSVLPLLGVTGVGCFIEIGEFLYKFLIIDSFTVTEGFKYTLGAVDDVLVFIFHVCLLYAIRAIAKETEVEKLSYAAVRNFVFMCVYQVLSSIALLPFSFVEGYKRYFSMPIILLYFALIILNLVLIFRCYANICDESDIDMPLKKSRFEFVNKIREETARREQKAADDSVEYARQKLEQRKSKRQNRRKNKGG